MKSMLQVLSCDLVGKAMLALVSALLIRYMSQADYALYSVAYALVLVFIQVCSGCLSRVYVVGFERFQLANDPGVLARLQFALLCLGAPTLLFVLGVAKPLSWICAGTLALGCAAELIKSRYQQEMRFGKFSSVEFARAAAICAGVAAITWFSGFRPTAMPVMAVQLLSFALIFGVYKLPALHLGSAAAWQSAANFAKALWRSSYRYLFLYFFILAFLNQIELLVLRYAGTEHQVATYAAAYRYYNVLILALTAANAVLLPAAQRVSTWQDALALKQQHRAALYLFLPVVALSIAAAGIVLPAIDGGKYPESPAVFRVLAVSSLLSFALSPALNIVCRYEDFRFLSTAAGLACVIGPLLNILFLPRFGVVGTAWSLLLSIGALNGAGFWRASRYNMATPLAVPA